MASEWERREGGYMRRDGEFFIERGAPMAGGNTNAWLIHRRVSEDRICADHPGGTIYDYNGGSPLWAVDETGYSTTVQAGPADGPLYDGDLYAHGWDAGSLYEAKYAVLVIEGRAA